MDSDLDEFDQELAELPPDDVELFCRNFYILRHRTERSRFRKSVVRKALSALVQYVRDTPGEEVGEDGVDESVCETATMWGGSDESWEPSDSEDELVGSADAALKARQGRCYSLAPYCDLDSWRGQLIVNPLPVGVFCEQFLLPLPLILGWIRELELEDDDPRLQFFTHTVAGVMRPDSFFIHMSQDSVIYLTRAGQRFLMELDEAHGRTIREWGAAREEGECYVDDEDIEARAEVVQWCTSAREAWGELFQRHLGNPAHQDDGGDKSHGRHGMTKAELRGKHLNNLEKKLRTKKGKANLVRRTKKQKDKDKQKAADASLQGGGSSRDELAYDEDE
eukprot:TRINITY_DN49780_c0_g1_i2.p1 TRINITY_DN49780_c0_g1~~TRINITY_DN49780_c0_g1_i2.p1  ORF type:complete len:336 (+),score=82.52 TRINITY_DN49780_c0_g1_i2:99-1106(+)